MRRVARVPIDGSLLREVFHIPKNAKIVDVRISPDHVDVLDFVFEHESLQPVENGAKIPTVVPILSTSETGELVPERVVAFSWGQ